MRRENNYFYTFWKEIHCIDRLRFRNTCFHFTTYLFVNLFIRLKCSKKKISFNLNNLFRLIYVVALVILKTGPILRNNRLRTLLSSAFKSKHIISHNNK